MKWALGSGVARDAGRLRWDSWKDGWCTRGKLKILAAATYICLASAIPALAFGVQASSDTEGLLSPVSVLAATAITGVMQALIGGQPLLIVGVAEPIVLTYGYMYDFAKGREGLGRERFLAWAAWCCVWAAAMIVVLALTNACVYIRHFTRLSGELFGMLIALLFLQQAIKGSVEEFRASDSSSWSGSGGSGSGELSPPADAATWQLVNGVWSLLLAFGLLLASLLLRTARSWRFGRAPIRGFLADYGAPLMLLAFSGLSFAVHGGGSGGGSVPRRVQTPNVWDASSNWSVAADMASLEGRWIAAALIPAALITVLFFFDHNVSAQLAQQEEFNLKKPPAYHYDFLLLGLMTLLCGLLGLPPVNGVLPQAPMHTKALAKVAGKRRSGSTQQAQQAQQQLGAALGPGNGTLEAVPAAGCVELGTANGGSKWQAVAGSFELGDLALPAAVAGSSGKSLHLSPSAQALLPRASSFAAGSSSFASLAAAAAEINAAAAVDARGGSSSCGTSVAVGRGSLDAATAPPVDAGQVLQAARWWAAAGSGSAAGGTAGGTVGGTAGGVADPAAGGIAGAAAEEVVAVHVYEQRWSGLLQSLGVAVFLFATPAIRQIPTACLWGYFAFMALESLPGSQFWDRLLLLVTDPRKRATLLERAHAPYLETVPFRVIAWFTAFQAAYLLLVYGVTWADVAGILFPLPIMALVPLRQWVLPRCFANRRHLQELDAAKEEEAAPLSHEQAMQEAAAQGLVAGDGDGTSAPGSGDGGAEGGDRSSVELEGSSLPDSEVQHLRVVHHLSRSSLINRRSTVKSSSDTGTSSATPTTAGAAGAAAAASAAAAGSALPGAAVHSPRAAAGLRRRSHELPPA